MKGKIAYVVADLEGSTGAWTKAHTLLGPEWQEARVELTRDINAVAEALFERNVKGVVVKDFHRTGYNFIPSYLDKRVKLVSGYYNGPAVGYGKLYGAGFALFVGLHASGGNERGFLAHTLTSRIAESTGGLLFQMPRRLPGSEGKNELGSHLCHPQRSPGLSGCRKKKKSYCQDAGRIGEKD